MQRVWLFITGMSILGAMQFGSVGRRIRASDVKSIQYIPAAERLCARSELAD